MKQSTLTDEFCAKDGSEVCAPQTDNFQEGKNRYFHYFQQIEVAKNVTVPCPYPDCNCFATNAMGDLDIFRQKGISKDSLDSVRMRGTKYQIIDHRLYRDRDCMFPARCSGIEHFIRKLLPKLRDSEFIINTRDLPQIPANRNQRLAAIFSFSKTRDFHDILYPAWSFWEGGPAISLYPTGIGRWDLHRKNLGKLSNQTLWDEKEAKGFFRGSRTNSQRDPLILLSRERPDLVDAHYTKNQAWKSEADTLFAPPAKEVSFEEHCKYKYLFNFRGVAASFRLKHLFLCKSLVFHIGNEWIEFFYPQLVPWRHFIPIATGSDQFVYRDLVEFVRDNDELSRHIAEEGFAFIWRNLRLKQVFCYWKFLLDSYTDLLQFKPVLDPQLILIN